MECAGNILYRVYTPNEYAGIPALTPIEADTGKVLLEKALPAEFSTGNLKYIPGGITFDTSYAPAGVSIHLIDTADAVYVLRNGELAKLDPKTLEPVKITHLFGPVVNVADDATAEAKALASIDHAQRTLPVMLLQGKDLLIISGDAFFRVNADTLTISKQARFTNVADAVLAKRIGQLEAYGQPYALSTPYGLLLTRGPECLLVDPRMARHTRFPCPMRSHIACLPSPAQPRIPLQVLTDGQTIMLNGVAWSAMAGDNVTWFFYDPRYGTMKLTGAKSRRSAKIPISSKAISWCREYSTNWRTAGRKKPSARSAPSIIRTRS